MKVFRTLIWIVMILSAIGSLALLGLGNPVWKWGAVLIALCFGVAGVGKALHLKLDTLRGKFHLILGIGALIFCAAIAVGLVSTTPWQIFGLHYLARFIFIVSVALMFVGLMKQGYTLSAGDWVVVLLLFTALAATGLWFFYTLYAGATVLMSILVYMSLFIMLVVLANVQVYLGSNLGVRWTAGALSVMFVTLGDMSMAYFAVSGLPIWETVQYLSWSVLGFIMGIICLLWD
jgi:hypothetical protein